MKILVEGTEIELQRTGSECRFRVDGGPERIADVRRAEPGVYSVLIDGRSYEARVEEGDGGVVVIIDGHRFPLEVRDPRRLTRRAAFAGAAGRQTITAPMPGKVVRVLAAVGDVVEAGQGILVVEAMKMQNELRASKAGRVAALSASQDATVAAGEVLAVIE
jgi:biotin carboxyl carrier protein